MQLTDDEYTCLLIMSTGENLIRMRDTRWYQPLTDLARKDMVRGIGNENFVITDKGREALQRHDETVQAAARRDIMQSAYTSAAGKLRMQKIHEAAAAIVEAARAMDGNGQPFAANLHSVAVEVGQRAQQLVQS